MRIVCKDKKSSFVELLARDGSVSTHNEDSRFLSVEIFRVSKGIINPQIVKEIFQFRDAMTCQV